MPSGTRKSVYPRQTPYANFQKAQRMKMSRRLHLFSFIKPILECVILIYIYIYIHDYYVI